MSDSDFNRGFERAEQAAYARHYDVDRCVVCGREGTDLCPGCEAVAE